MKRTHSSVHCTDIKRWTESINLSAVCFLLPQHYMYTTLYSELCRAQRSSPGRLTCFLWNVYSDALPECLAAGELSGLFRPRQHFTRECFRCLVSPLWSWPVASWTQRVHKKRKQSGEKGRGLVLIARHKARFSHSPGNTDRWWSLNQQRPQCWTCGRALKTRSLSSTAAWGKRDVRKTELLHRGELEGTAGVDG